MAIEVRKFGQTLNLAWQEPRRPHQATLFIDSDKGWKVRRRLLNDGVVNCVVLHFKAAQPHDLSDFAEALEAFRCLNYEKLHVIACNAAVVPSLAVVSGLLPESIALVNPRPCANQDRYQDLLEETISLLQDVPLTKIIYNQNDEFGSSLAVALEPKLPHLRQLGLSDLNSETLQIIRSPGYVESFSKGAK
jgi:hypothetical protein